ncbi:protein POOR HOMOLOGOUS SYNAPSIS 1-like [Chenopodium quinoa]|uniref:protein POOR HOMOLOGOUS SYNAPSIS 1-like n=1 Tax=Chenopodium quinoa TaxID=63459 RepID=UPI000B778E93|nr:protein POOR HOMOLOGOUS SYNAPSIS 1-like [Chenopodium quinoa]
MAGAQELKMAERETQKSLMATPTTMTTRDLNQWQWKIQYARCFTYPSSYLSKTTAITTSTSPSFLSPLKRSQFKPVWITSSGFSIVSLHPSTDACSSADSILTVSLQGTVVEDHFISKLQFVWPQVSCLSGFPTRGSLVVFASYVDCSDEKQKFAMRFSGVLEVQNFITSLQAILSNKIPNRPLTVSAISAMSSQSEFIPAYRPDTSSMMTPAYDSNPSKNLLNEYQELQTQNTVADSQSNVEALPPRFTSLVSSCSAEHKHDELALALAPGPQEFNLKAQISKYMQDASFLDMVNKVNEVITELGDDFTI